MIKALHQSHAEYAAPLLPSGLWQPDIEQSVGTDPALASWFNASFSMLPRYALPFTWHVLHQPEPFPRLELWFILNALQVVLLVWQAMQ